MKNGFFRWTVMGAALPLALMAQNNVTAKPESTGAKIARSADGHPDLSGVWAFTIDLPRTALKTEVNGKATVKEYERGTVVPRDTPFRGALPSKPKPTYKPELQSKVAYLSEHESKEDPVFYCGRPGIPRIGPPRKIVQSPKEMIFFYEDISGDPYRIIPTDGRGHRKNANPSYYGDSIGKWEGDTFVVDAVNFADDLWFGEDGYFHSDQMHVTERFWRDGDDLVYQAIVDDPGVLAEPWVKPPRVVKPSTEALEESPKCVETDAGKLTNNDHHLQR